MSDAPSVLVCGAGPTGLALALELVRFGVQFRIVDRAFAGARYSQALALQARTLELLEPTGLTEALVRRAHRLRRVRVRDGSRALLDLDLGGMPTHYDYVAIVPQRTTERLMLERLAELGVEVERGVTLTDVRQDDDGATVTLAHTAGVERLTVPYVAACDGAASTIRSLLAVDVEQHAAAEYFLIADGDFATALPSDGLTFVLGQDSVAAFVPMGRSWRAIVAAAQAFPPEPSAGDLSAALAALDIDDVTPVHLDWVASFSAHQRKVARYRAGRVFFLGDAAHVHSPLAGQGLNAGIGDAVNLGWKLALVVRDGAADALLETYAQERDGIATAVLGAGALERRLTAANPVLRRLRDTLVPLATRFDAVRTRLRENVAQLRIAYPRSPLSVHGRSHVTGTVAGARLRGARPSGYRPRIMMMPGDDGGVTTIVVRPDGYAGYVNDGHAHGGAEVYLRNVVGMR